MRRIARDTYENSNQSREFADREVIILNQADTVDDLEFALSKLQEIDSTIVENDIDMVKRFHQKDDSGYFPLKVVLKKKTVAQRLVETFETSEEEIDWIRRGQTWSQRAKNRRVQENIELKNEDLPGDTLYVWGPKFVGGYLIKQPRYLGHLRHQGNGAEKTTTNQQLTNSQARDALNGLNEALLRNGPGAEQEQDSQAPTNNPTGNSASESSTSGTQTSEGLNPQTSKTSSDSSSAMETDQNLKKNGRPTRENKVPKRY